MKLIILKDNLRNALDSVGRAISNNASLPILGNILIKTSDNQIKIFGTNLEIAITKTVSGKILEDGGVTIPYTIISTIINNLSSERINLESKGNNLTLQTDNYKALIQGAQETDFPIIPKLDKKNEFLEIQANLFKESLGKVIIAAGISEIRPEISGVLFDVEVSSLKMAATDSFRLAETKIPGNQFKSALEQGFRATIPLRTAQELSKIFKDGEDIKIYFDKTQVLFETKDTEIVSRLIDGDFPDYQAIIPQNTDTEITVEREELMNSLKLASAFSGRVNEIRLRTKDKRVLEVYSSESSLGENDYLIPGKISGEEIEVVFNWRFLLDGIKSVQSKDVVLGLSGGNKAAVIKSPDDKLSIYILMPVRTT